MTDREYLDEFESEFDRKLVSGNGSLDKLNAFERLAVLRRSFQWEVNNGGLPIFFYNLSGDSADETTEMLRKIGANEAARIVSDAISLFGDSGPSRDCLTRRQQMTQMSEQKKQQFEKLSSEYFRLEDRGLSTADLLDELLLTQWRQSTH